MTNKITRRSFIAGSSAALVAGGLALNGCSFGAADKVVYGDIYTGVEDCPHATAAAIKDGKYIYVGDEDGVKSYIGDKTEVLDYKGKFCCSNYVDSHCHGISYIETNCLGFDVSSADSVLQQEEIVLKFIEDNPEIEIYRGQG